MPRRAGSLRSLSNIKIFYLSPINAIGCDNLNKLLAIARNLLYDNARNGLFLLHKLYKNGNT